MNTETLAKRDCNCVILTCPGVVAAVYLPLTRNKLFCGPWLALFMLLLRLASTACSTNGVSDMISNSMAED